MKNGIREKRTLLGWAQEELSIKVGVARQTIVSHKTTYVFACYK
ncbi:hypothetical protein C2W64_02551 [Brevibacillus laterosporus]|nr:hypothetical protein [Brevibacillus laterosporus]RAP29996.1 hypothetical protein C2W64_02551 [Brevibacillus laterosporus]